MQEFKGNETTELSNQIIEKTYEYFKEIGFENKIHISLTLSALVLAYWRISLSAHLDIKTMKKLFSSALEKIDKYEKTFEE